MSDKKYYWLKLKRDFFKRHDIKIIETMENGEKYLLFYLKLLVESLDHNGNLRFSDTIPYNEKMLAAITGTDIDIVRSAVKIFTELSMMDKLNDGTLFMSQVLTMTGDETKFAEQKRLYRERHKEDIDRTLSDKSIELRVKSIEYRDKIEDKSKSATKVAPLKFQKPTLQNVLDYCQSRNNSVDASKFIDHYESVGWKVGRNPMKDWQASVRTWEKSSFNTASTKKEPYRFNAKDFE